MTIFDQLKAPFPPDRILWRVGDVDRSGAIGSDGSWLSGQALPYIDARDAMDRLDEVVGPENWQCEYPHAGIKTVCRIGIRIGGEGLPTIDGKPIVVGGEFIWKSDGAGDTENMEAVKGALSDAFKRAATRWGIGRYLYAMPKLWVDVVQNGKRFEIPDLEADRLLRFLCERIPAEWFVQGLSSNARSLMEDMGACETDEALTEYFKQEDVRQRWYELTIQQRAAVTVEGQRLRAMFNEKREAA